jgi:hypothetical protein
MSNSKLEQLDAHFSATSSSKQKLDYWKENFYDKFMQESNLMDLLGNIIEYIPIYKEDDIIAKKVFKHFECDAVHTSAKIPAEIHLKHFPNFERDVEYTNWFLVFNAGKWARGYYISKFQSKLNNEITDELIEAELNELKIFEDKATAYLLAKEITIDDNHYYGGLKPFQELKRLQSDYYKGKVVSSFNLLGGNSVVDIYSKYVLYKNWLIVKHEKFTNRRDRLSQGDLLILEKIQKLMDEMNFRFDGMDHLLRLVLGEQKIIARMLQNLENDKISSSEQRTVFDILQSGINELINKLSENDARDLKSVANKIKSEPDLKGKLKMIIPIIPFLLNYENELSWDWRKANKEFMKILI